MNNLPNTHLHPLEKANSLEGRFRLLLQNPGRILKKHIHPGMTVLDLGCGTGFFTIEIAKLLNNEGKIIASDVQDGMLDILKQKLKKNDLQHLKPIIQIHHNQENSLCLTEKVDFILAFYSFHEMRYIDNIIDALARIVKPETQILISEQKFHVSKQTFSTIIKKMEHNGFEIFETPKIFFSRTVIMKQKNEAMGSFHNSNTRIMIKSILDIAALNDQMVEISGGQIKLRDDRTKQKWTVKVDSFLLNKFPVTQELYANITKENPSAFKDPNKPVETVGWEEAVLFCNQLSKQTNLKPCYKISADNETVVFDHQANGFRLPTEAEWQFACQAGTKEIRYAELDEIAWYKNNSQNSTQKVGQKEPNSFGLYDMLGNVWEWCNDIYDETIYGSYRIFRGGGWCDEKRSVMATTRRRSHPISFKIDDLGFRIARNID